MAFLLLNLLIPKGFFSILFYSVLLAGQLWPLYSPTRFSHTTFRHSLSMSSKLRCQIGSYSCTHSCFS